MPRWAALAVCLAALISGSRSPAAHGGTPPADPPARGSPAELTAAERAFLDARLDRAVELLRADQRDSSDGLLLAYSLFLRGEESAAANQADETLRAPHYRDERVFRGLLALLTGNLAAALDALGGAGPPPRFFTRVLHAETLILAGRFEDAQAAADALARDFPGDPLVPHTRGHLESARGHWAPAIESYTRSAQMGGPNPDLDEGIAAAHIALRQYPQAREAIARCRRAFPDYAEILYQAIRLERAAPERGARRLQGLVDEYRRRSRRQDRLAEVAQWMGKT